MAKLTLQCWKCHENFQRNIDLSNKPAILIPCPYCSAPCYFDAERNRKAVAEVYRHSGGDVSGGSAPSLPPVLKTVPPPDKK